MTKSKSSPHVVELPMRALYTIAELARFSRLTRHKMVRLLRAHHVEFVRSGRAFYVPLCELEEKMQPLWRSLRVSDEVRRRRGEGSML